MLEPQYLAETHLSALGLSSRPLLRRLCRRPLCACMRRRPGAVAAVGANQVATCGLGSAAGVALHEALVH